MNKNEAIQLISLDPQSNKLVFNPDAEKYIKSLKDPIGVISVVGKYRTGKSYLLNRIILNNKTGGFNVGPTIQSCTKGLWIMPQPLTDISYEGKPVNVLLMDTEGIGSLEEDINHDNKIFTLSLLLSSYFMYNSQGSIDENAIQSLS
jgi:hypothetical protein